MSFHALPHGAGWAVRRSKSARCIAMGMSRAEAWREARRLARGRAERAYLFGTDGRIVARNDYGASE